MQDKELEHDLLTAMVASMRKGREDAIRQQSLTDQQKRLIERKQTFKKFVCTK